MKLLTIAALAASLLFSAEPSSAPANRKFTAEQTAKWKEINENLKAAAEAAERAELAFYRAKEVRDKALAEGNAALVKMQAEAKCPNCMPAVAADGSLSWPAQQEAAKK